jgi:hypothetical protein
MAPPAAQSALSRLVRAGLTTFVVDGLFSSILVVVPIVASARGNPSTPP